MKRVTRWTTATLLLVAQLVTTAVCADALAPPAPTAAPATITSASSPAPRPRIGLVLAGGGAKGGAHVGVLKVLEERRVPVDCIAGTSMGALVGAGYAAGLPADRLEKFVTGIDWGAIVAGVGRRPLEPIAQQQLQTAASTHFELGLQHRHIVTPGGLTNTSGIDDLLRSYVAQARMVSEFDRLPIPYRAVATDMVTGRMVVLDHGDLATAMRASMAIPGVFAPVVLDRYVLADGGQVRNIPVDVARDTCADLVIVVNLVEPETPAGELVQATQLLARSMEVMLQANEDLQLATLTPRDVRIDVPLGNIGTADFLQVPETIPLGERAARAVVARLDALALPADEYQAWRTRVTTSQDVRVRMADVRFDGLTRVNPDYLRTLVSIEPGDEVDVAAISEDAMRLAVLDDIDSVSYRLEGDPAAPSLVWIPAEASIGPNVLRPSMGVYAAGGGDMKFKLGAQYVRHWANSRGAQWRNEAQVGYESLFRTSWYQPFDVAQRFFVEPALAASRSIEDLYVDGDRIAEYAFYDVGGGIDIGLNLSTVAQASLGYFATGRRADVQTGIAQLPGGDLDGTDAVDAGIAANFVFDSRDAAVYAVQGAAAQLRYRQSAESLGADRDWGTVEAAVRKAIPFGKATTWLSLAGGTELGGDELPADRAFSIGGPRTFAAYGFGEVRARSYWLADAGFLWRLVDLVALFDQSLFGGFGLQAAGFRDRVDLVADGEAYGLAAYVGGVTPIGALTLGGAGSDDAWAVWLSLGRPIGRGSLLDEGIFR